MKMFIVDGGISGNGTVGCKCSVKNVRLRASRQHTAPWRRVQWTLWSWKKHDRETARRGGEVLERNTDSRGRVRGKMAQKRAVLRLKTQL